MSDLVHKREIEINVVVYKNLKVACESLGLDYTRIRHIIDRYKLSLNDAISYESCNNSVEYDGIVYKSIMNACKILGLSYSTIFSRMNVHKISFEDAVNYQPLVQKKEIEYNGVVYKSLASACKSLNVSYDKVRRRMIKDNLSFGEAIKEIDKIAKNNKKEVVYNGVVYDSISKACRDLNLDYDLISGRMLYHDITFEEAIDFNGIRHKKCSYNGIDYRSLAAACRDLDLNYNYMGIHLRDGMSFEDAVHYSLVSKSMRLIKLQDNLYKCKCRKCNKSMLLTLDLAFNHINECNN